MGEAFVLISICKRDLTHAKPTTDCGKCDTQYCQHGTTNLNFLHSRRESLLLCKLQMLHFSFATVYFHAQKAYNRLLHTRERMLKVLLLQWKGLASRLESAGDFMTSSLLKSWQKVCNNEKFNRSEVSMGHLFREISCTSNVIEKKKNIDSMY